MTRTTAAVVVALVAAAAVAQTRRPAPPAGAPVVSRLAAHLGDKALVDELKLSDEQVKALRNAAAKSPGGESAIAAKVKEVLSAEQYARAVQLMAQDALRTGRGAVVTPSALVTVPAATLRRYPELVEAANLTREQKRRAAGGPAQPNPNFGGPQPAEMSYGGLPGGAHILLTPEQTAALTRFVGPLRTAPFGVAPGPTDATVTAMRPTFAGNGPPWQRVMTAVNNRGELKLNEKQVTTLNDLSNRARGVVRFNADGSAPNPPPQPLSPADTEKELAKALNPEQMTRLKQIERWQQLPPGGDATAKFDLPGVTTEVGLDSRQKTDLKAVSAAHRARAAAALKAAKSAADLKVELAAARADTDVAVDKLLSDAQRSKLGELFGADYRGGPARNDNDIFRRIRSASYGMYQFELMIVNRFGGTAEDLRLSEEQKAAFTAAERDYYQQQRNGGVDYEAPEAELAKKMGEQSKAMQKVFDDVFTADQKKRFRELCIQARQALNAQQLGTGGMYPATGVPGVADELKLTAEQRKRIRETGDEDAVLTAEQQSQLKRMTGVPIAGGFNFGGGGRSRPTPPSARLLLLHAGAAHADLGLNAEQAFLIAETIEEHAAELRPPTTGRTGELGGYVEPPQPEAVEDTVKACEKAVNTVLTAAQRDRLGQLVLQVAAHGSLTTTFARPEVAAKLALTVEQKATLAEIAADFRARVAQVNGLPGTAGWMELRQKAIADARTSARERMTAVLTATQARAWRALTGPECPAVAAAASGDAAGDP
ncbi:hypothetical protein [Urbifossiella limnaea]|uniref:LTXXQ motif protein n=1 Tax=Urbifossiella limnaea TaxID=2528023 RepID=A0A517XNU6_9BACT|nr:hypothetical protein [Urbifossiella limnaea]QDU19181.1 LTXXQ motif protein [Urbifossiella limnaea]